MAGPIFCPPSVVTALPTGTFAGGRTEKTVPTLSECRPERRQELEIDNLWPEEQAQMFWQTSTQAQHHLLLEALLLL